MLDHRTTPGIALDACKYFCNSFAWVPTYRFATRTSNIVNDITMSRLSTANKKFHHWPRECFFPAQKKKKKFYVSSHLTFTLYLSFIYAGASVSIQRRAKLLVIRYSDLRNRHYRYLTEHRPGLFFIWDLIKSIQIRNPQSAGRRTLRLGGVELCNCLSRLAEWRL